MQDATWVEKKTKKQKKTKTKTKMWVVWDLIKFRNFW